MKPMIQGRLWFLSSGRPAAATSFTGLSVVAMSHLLDRRLAEQAFGFEHHHQDQDGEHGRVRPLLAEAVRRTVVDALDEADEQTTEDRSVEVADAAQDGRR